MERERAGERYFIESRHRSGRNAAKWICGVLLSFALAGLIVTVSAYQVTSEGVAKRALARAVAALTEIDLLLDQNLALMRDDAQSARPGETVQLADFPVEVGLTAEEAQRPQAEVRRLILERAADRLYADGTDALRADAESADDIGPFSAAGATENGLGLLRRGAHTALGVAMVVLAVTCAGLVAGVVLLSRGFGRAVSVGMVVTVAALPVAIASLGLRLLLRETGGDGALEREIFAVAEDLFLVPIRISLAFLGAGIVLVASGVAGARALDASEAISEPDHEPARSAASGR